MQMSHTHTHMHTDIHQYILAKNSKADSKYLGLFLDNDSFIKQTNEA